MTHPIQFEAFAAQITLERETRTIRGEITAYGVPTTDYRRIVIEAGALRPRLPLSRVKMLVDHDQRQPVGFMSELDADARVAAFKIPEGEAGDKALADAANGLRDGLSVGINVLDEPGAFMYDENTGTYHVYAAELLEVSLCAIPAYADAGVTSVAASHHPTNPQQKEHATMDPETLEQILDQRFETQNVELERVVDTRLATLSGGTVSSGPTWPTFGAFIKDLASGSTVAAEFYQELAYGGAKSSDDATRNTWIGDAIRLVEKNRKVLNTFTREPLPADGMTLEYLQLKSNSITVEKQAAQGDNLPYGKIQLQSKTAPIDTYGGYTELTKQIIDRATSAYVSTAFKAMDIEYARATEAAVRAVLEAAIAARITANDTLAIGATADAYDWLDLIVDAAEAYDDRGYSLDGSYVSKDVFKRLIRLEDTNGNSLMRVHGQGVNQVGEIDLTGLTGSLASVQFKLLPGADAGTMAFYDSIAITTWESAGAPFQLQQQNVINLTEAFSEYGYLAVASQFPDALLPVEIAPAA